MDQTPCDYIDGVRSAKTPKESYLSPDTQHIDTTGICFPADFNQFKAIAFLPFQFSKIEPKSSLFQNHLETREPCKHCSMSPKHRQLKVHMLSVHGIQLPEFIVGGKIISAPTDPETKIACNDCGGIYCLVCCHAKAQNLIHPYSVTKLRDFSMQTIRTKSIAHLNLMLFTSSSCSSFR